MPLYVAESGNPDQIAVIPETTGNGQTAVADAIFNLPQSVDHGGVTVSITDPQAVAIDGNDLYVADDSGNEIFIIPADTGNGNTATISRRIVLPTTISTPTGLAISGNDLYIRSGTTVFIIDKNTADNTTATISRQFTYATGTGGFTIDGNDLYIYHHSNREIHIVPANTANNTTATRIRFFRLSNTIGTSGGGGIAINGNSLYVANSGEILEVPANTANNTTATDTNNFDLPSGITQSRGLAFGESNATYTLSTTDTDIREGESVTIDVTASLSVTGLEQPDFSITGGTITGFSGSGTDYELTVTAGLAGTMEITLAADAGTPTNAETSESFTVNPVRMLHIADGTDDNIRVIRWDTGDGDTAQSVRTYEVTDSDDMQSIVFDGTHIHVTNWNESTVRVFSPSGVNNTTLTLVRSYTVSGISQPSGMAFDGTNIHISDRNDDNIRVLPPDTADGGTATLVRTYTVDGLDDCRGMTFDGTNIHAADYTDDNIRVFAPNHTSGDAADITYTVAGLNHCRAMGFDGVNLHLFDVNDHNIRVIAVPTADGAQTILRTYNAQSAETVRGMTATPMAITIHTSDSDIREGESITFDIIADLDITGLSLSDITHTGATATSLASVTARRYRLQSTANAGAGDIVISIPANAVIPGNIAVSKTFTRSARATATITFANTELINNQQTLATITFSEAITSFDRSDLSLSAGTLGATLTEVSDTVYRIAVTAPATGSGTMTLSIPQDSTIPENELATGHIDYAPPPSTDITANITMPTGLRAGRTANATVEWSESVDDFDAADVSVDVGTIGTITGTGTTYTLPITAPTTPTSGTITLTIREDAVSQGNAVTTSVVGYSALPTVTMSTTDTDIHVNDIFVVSFEWSEAVTGFATGDVTVTNATKVNFVALDGDSYTMALRATAAGDIVVTVAEDATNEGNAEASETFVSNAILTVAITFDETELVTGGTTTVSMNWNETPTGFTVDDVSVTAGTITDFAVDGTDDTLYTTTLTAPNTGSGTIMFRIHSDAVDEGNAYTTATIDYAPPFSVTWGSVPTMTTGLAFNAQLNFGVAVTGLAVDDIRLRRSDSTLFTPTATELTITEVSGTNNYTLAFDWDGVITGTGTYLLRLLADAVTYRSDTYPDANLNSTNFMIDADFGVQAIFTISTTDTDIRANETTDIQITSSIDVTNFVLGDITVTGATANSLTQNAADDYTLNITAEDGAGTITFSIAENVVDETNAAASQDFTRNANPTATVMFADSELETDGMTTVTVMWSESVTGFDSSDTSVDFGTLSGFAGSGATYTETLTAPSSGSGTIEYTIAANAVVQGNAETTESIDYAPPEPETDLQSSTALENTYDADLGYNVLPEALGALRRINANGTVTSLGNLYYEERAFNVALTRALSFDDELHVTMGYGNPLELLRYNSLASHADNFVHLVYGNRLHYIVPEFNPSGSVYDALAELAIKVNATLVFDGNIVRLLHREAFEALTNGGTGTGTGNLAYDSENQAFPSSGYLMIEREVIGYTGRTQTAFTGVTRGVLGTDIANHPNNTKIVGIEAIVGQNRLSTEPDITQDTSRIYNVIADGQNVTEERDSVSIGQFGEKTYGLSLELTRHEKAWQQHIFQSYLRQLKDVHQLIDVSVLPPLDLDIGQVIATAYGELVYGLRIIAIAYTREGMRVVGRTV